MLTLDGLELRQGDFRLQAQLSVVTGEKVALIGPSGAGKSTLLAAIAGFLVPEAGRILWQGRDVSHLPPGARPVSIVFQDNNLFPHLDVFDNVALGVRPSLRLSEAEREGVRRALSRVGLEGLERRKPAQLSGGQQSRVALARVLVRARPLLLLDEPFAALGPALRADMLDLVAEVVGDTGATLLMVTHDPRDAERIADRAVLVADGVAQPPVRVQELLANPPAALRDYLGQ